MKFTVATIAAVVAVANASNSQMEGAFKLHSAKYGLTFESAADHADRLAAFMANDEIISKHNAGNHSFELGHNQFSHLTFAEFEAIYLNEPAPRKESSRWVNHFEDATADDVVDWSTSDMVTAVKDQGSCGSCWAFSTTGAMEGAYYLKNKSQQSFSEQQLVDCDTVADQGCSGGLMDNAFTYIAANGLTSESDYPYTSGGGQAGECQSFTPVEGSVGITFTDVTNSEEALAKAVTQQPIAVAVDADSNWQLYKGGIMTVVEGQQLDHGVLAVGFGKEDGQAFWKIKNSWAEAWGEDGYIRITKDTGGDPPCGITLAPSYPTLA